MLTAGLAGAQDHYVLESKYPVHDLQSALRVIADPEDTLSRERLLLDSGLVYMPGADLPRYLEVGVTYWGKLRLIARDTLNGWALHLEDRMIGLPAWTKSNGKVDVYAYCDRELIFHHRTGVEYPRRERDKAGHWVLNQIALDRLPVDTPVTLLLKVQGNSIGYPAYFNLSARSPAQAHYHRIYQFHNSFNIFMFGVAFIILLYHVLQFMYLRQKVFFWFSLWLLSCTLTMAMATGLIIGDFTAYRFPVWLLLANSVFYTFWFFGREFINSRQKFPTLDKYILGVALFVLAEIVGTTLYVLIARPQAHFTGVGYHYPLLHVYTIASLILAVLLSLKKDPFARYFGLGALIGSATLILGTLWSMGLIRPYMDPYPVGMFLQIVIFSFGIAYRQQVLSGEAQAERLQAQQTYAEMQRMRDLDNIKTRFFANISHEFRTPLTLISGPLQQARERSGRSGAEPFLRLDTKAYTVIQKNTERLHHLVDQLLELSKLESGQMHLSLRRGGLMAFIRSLLYSFESMAERRNINLHTHCSADNPQAFYDADKLEKILTNLLSNAFKYTPDGGTITAVIDLGADYLSLEVSDTGKGIDKAEIKHIFERFYRVEGSEKKGSGIGLALTKELVDLHQGTIRVESVKGMGTTFRVRLPISLKELPEAISVRETVGEGTASGPELPAPEAVRAGEERADPAIPEGKDRPVVLLVEDNAELRDLIADMLAPYYQLLSAGDGAQGERMAFEHIPDVVISDVMMPKKDGYQLCHSLKNNPKTSHIPIIMLTAKAGQDHKMEGLIQGADSYLTKPFDPRELRIRLKNLIEAREKLWEHFKSLDMFLADDLEIASVDDRFLQDVFQCIKDNLDNEQFGVEEIGRKVGFSRSQLHRKFKALLGKSPNQLIVEVRLNEAYRLLKQGAGSVSEVAYSVGYSNLSYFAKSFKRKFGLLPSKVEAELS